MLKNLLKLVQKNQKSRSENASRVLLEKKVVAGTDLAIKQYGDVFRMLAEYDRT